VAKWIQPGGCVLEMPVRILAAVACPMMRYILDPVADLRTLGRIRTCGAAATHPASSLTLSLTEVDYSLPVVLSPTVS
jgi:hypothetical protein